MKKRYIICAGNRYLDEEENYYKYYEEMHDFGKPDRWSEHLGVKEHMIPVKGEPILHRIQRLLIENGAEDIVVKCNPRDAEQYVINGVKHTDVLHPQNSIYPDNELVYAEPLYIKDGINVLLFGDFYYSDEILSHIINNKSDHWHHYGRLRSSKVTGKLGGETFAWYFHGKDKDFMVKMAEKASIKTKELVKLSELNIISEMWRMEDSTKIGYRMMAGLDPEDPHAVENFHWIEWDDETEDFDYPEDWERWAKRLPHLAY